MSGCELRRLDCRRCGHLALEPVAWARPGAPYTRDLEDVVAWLCQQMAKTPITRLLRIGWASVGKIVERVVADHLDEGRLDGLVWLGIDELHHGHGNQFLTCVVDHQSGASVSAAPGRNAETLQGFFDQLTEAQKASIEAVSIDMSAGYEKAIRAEAGVPDAQVCLAPFHVVAFGGKAVDQVRRAEHNRHGRSGSEDGTWIKGTRYSLVKDPANQTVRQLAKLHEVQQTNKALYRAFLLLNELRWLYRIPRKDAPAHLQAWLAWASRSRLKPFATWFPTWGVVEFTRRYRRLCARGRALGLLLSRAGSRNGWCGVASAPRLLRTAIDGPSATRVRRGVDLLLPCVMQKLAEAGACFWFCAKPAPTRPALLREGESIRQRVSGSRSRLRAVAGGRLDRVASGSASGPSSVGKGHRRVAGELHQWRSPLQLCLPRFGCPDR